MHGDTRLAVPGGDLARVHGAGRITRLLNTHPDETDAPRLGREVVIVGQGNVAMDVARLLARTAEGLDGTDVADAAHERLAGDVRTIHLVGRSAPDSAKFDPVMVRELAGLPGIRHIVHGIEALPDDGKDARIDAVRALAAAAPGIERVRMEWWFGLTPSRIEGNDAGCSAVTFVSVRGEVVLHADDVITAIGFRAEPGSPGRARHDRRRPDRGRALCRRMAAPRSARHDSRPAHRRPRARTHDRG